MDSVLIPIFVVFGVPAAAFAMIYFISKQENETKRAMIQQGMNPYDGKKRNAITPGALKFGGLLMGAGIGTFLALLISNYSTLDQSIFIYSSLIAFFGGLGLILAHNYARKQYIEDQKNANN